MWLQHTESKYQKELPVDTEGAKVDESLDLEMIWWDMFARSWIEIEKELAVSGLSSAIAVENCWLFWKSLRETLLDMVENPPLVIFQGQFWL